MSEENKDNQDKKPGDKKPGWGSAIVGFFNTASDIAQNTGKKAFAFAKKTVDENPVLVEAAFVAATTVRMHPKVRLVVLAGHTLYKISQQNKPK